MNGFFIKNGDILPYNETAIKTFTSEVLADSPVLGTNATAVTQTTGNSSTKLATTEFVKNTVIAYPKAFTHKTSNYVITDIDDTTNINVDTTAGDITITLPLLSSNVGRVIKIAHVRSTLLTGNFTASIATTTTLNVTVAPSVPITIGSVLLTGGATAGTYVSAFGTGSGGTGSYVLAGNAVATVASTTFTATTSPKVIISPNATDTNKISNDELDAIWLPKVGNYVELQANSDTGYWEILNKNITCFTCWQGQSGYGSGATQIRYYTLDKGTCGNMFTVSNSTVTGMSITINKTGIYSFNFTNGSALGTYAGLTIDANSYLSTALNSVPSSYVRSFTTQNGTGATQQVSLEYSGYFTKGQIIRPHGRDYADVPPTFPYFEALYIN